MNIPVLFRVSLRALLRNKMRSFLTMLGIVIGVAAVISMVSITSGARTAVKSQISSLGDNVFMIFSGSFSRSGTRMGFGTRQNLTLEDVQAIREQSPSIRYVSPMVRSSGQLVFADQNWTTQLYGVSPEYLDIRRYEIAHGRMFSETDERGSAKVAVVGQTVVDNVFGGSDPVGSIVRVKRMPFEIIGRLAPKGQSSMGQDQDDVVLVPLSTAVKKFQGGETRVNMIVGSAVTSEAVPQAQDEISTVLRARHRIGAADDDDFIIRTQSEISQAVEGQTQTMTVLLGSVALVSLLVGGIGIMNIMLVSVTERTREIGIRMSVGARERDILWQFLLEAISLSALGGLLGIALGYTVSVIISKFAGWPTQIDPATAFIALAFASLVGIFFGFYPARKASRLDPIEALRYE